MSDTTNLEEQAKELGIPTNSNIYRPKNEAWVELQITEIELHRRIREEKRHRREHCLYLIAVISAVISLLSCVATYSQIFMHHSN
jgi:hypothetical protein